MSSEKGLARIQLRATAGQIAHVSPLKDADACLIARFTTEGELHWAEALSSRGVDGCSQLAVDAWGNTLVALTLAGDDASPLPTTLAGVDGTAAKPGLRPVHRRPDLGQ